MKTKIGQTYIVYLKNSNHYFQFEEPSWFVFSKLRQGYRSVTIANKFSERYCIDLNESLRFVNRFKLEMQHQLESSLSEKQDNSSLHFSFHPTDSKKYRINNIVIEFRFASDYLCSLIHPLLSHFEVYTSESFDNEFELFYFENEIFLRVNGQISGDWNFEETAYLKGVIFLQLANVIYKKSTNEWLMSLHASSVSNGKSSIFFTAPPNHGKTTFAMLLKKVGYRLISDDFIPVDHDGKAYPFPLSVSIRQSTELADEIIPELNSLPVKYITPDKSVRFASFNETYNYADFILPIKAIVFIKFDKNSQFSFEKLNSDQSMLLFFEQSWIAPGIDAAEKLFSLLPRLQFYKLTYCDFDRALASINDLFNNSYE